MNIFKFCLVVSFLWFKCDLYGAGPPGKYELHSMPAAEGRVHKRRAPAKRRRL